MENEKLLLYITKRIKQIIDVNDLYIFKKDAYDSFVDLINEIKSELKKKQPDTELIFPCKLAFADNYRDCYIYNLYNYQFEAVIPIELFDIFDGEFMVFSHQDEPDQPFRNPQHIKYTDHITGGLILSCETKEEFMEKISKIGVEKYRETVRNVILRTGFSPAYKLEIQKK